MKKSIAEVLVKNPALPWVLAFLLLALAVTQDGGTNPLSRFAAMRAITENNTLHINQYTDWTLDWSKSPNGNHYSNKAPGANLLGLPVFAATELLVAPLEDRKRDEKGRRPQPGYFQSIVLILCLQLLPFCWLILLISRWLESNGVSVWKIHLFAVASLFGNTAAILMNSWFGHGLAAWLMLAFSWLTLRKSYAAAGLALGFSVLTDYGGTLALPFALGFVWVVANRSAASLARFCLGGLLPAALWVWYHSAAFGGPLQIASLYINPEQLNEGAPSIFQQAEILIQLLFGPVRGLLVTQPWVLVAGGMFLFSGRAVPKEQRAHEWFCLATLAALLVLSSSTFNWHAGFTPGPRYLSVIFPSIALALALRPISNVWIPSVALSVGLALAFRGLIYPFSILAPPDALWPTHISWLLHPNSGTAPLRLSIFLLVLSTTGWFAWRRLHESRRGC